MSGGRLRVLAVSDEPSSLLASRLRLPLASLQASGDIGGYFVSGSSLMEVPSAERFDVVWVQRCRNAGLVDRLRERLGGRYMLDVDDFLLGRPSYRPTESRQGREALARAIADCAVLTSTSERLVGLLEEELGISLGGKAVVCPNAVLASADVRAARRPSGLLVAQSDHAALARSGPPVFRAVCDVAGRHGLSVSVVGQAPKVLLRLAAERSIRLERTGRLGYWEYHSRLAAWPALLGVCPLETHADEETLRFIRGKSDVKLVDFAGHGHPAVYSRAEPYTDTDLHAGVVVENDEGAWTAALEGILQGGWRSAAEEQSHVVELRDAAKVAHERWLPALDAARLGRSWSGGDLRRMLTPIGRPLRAFIGAAARADELLQGRVSWRVEQVAKGLTRTSRESALRGSRPADE